MVTVEYDTTDASEQILWPDIQNKSNNFLLASLEESKEENLKSDSFYSKKNNCPYTCVKNVNISIDIDDEDTGILFMNNEMEPLIEYCQV
jgi:hypothetical protein